MKKFTALLICLLLIAVCGLTGCASFSIDKVKYYNEVLAKVGDTNITRYDLLSAYNSYGYSNFVSNKGQSEKEALESTLNLLIDRECLYQYAKSDDNNKPTANQVGLAIEDILSSNESQIASYLETANTIFHVKTTTVSADNKSDTAYSIDDYNYSKRAQLTMKNGKLTISYIPQSEKTSNILESSLLENPNNDTIKEIVKLFEERVYSKIDEQRVSSSDFENKTDLRTALYNKVISLMSKDLINYEYYLRDENGNAYSKSTQDLLERYFKRNLDSEIKSLYLENLRTYYLEHEELKTELLLDEYENMFKSNFETYYGEESAYKTAMKDIGTKGDTIVYHPTLSDGTKFGYFIHTLISFTTNDNAIDGHGQQEALKSLDTTYTGDSEKSENEKQANRNKIISKTSVKARNEDGIIPEDATAESIEDVVKYYNNNVANQVGYKNRLEAFKKFMFKYSGDTATLSSGMPYVVGSYNKDKGETFETNSSYVEQFTDEAISLMNQGEGAMSKVSYSESINFDDNFCVTTYGIHFLFYIGDVSKFDLPVDYDSFDTINKPYFKLDGNESFDPTGKLNLASENTILNIMTGETYFDMLFDAVYPASSDEDNFTSNTGYNDFEDSILEQTKYLVQRNESKIKGTKANLN